MKNKKNISVTTPQPKPAGLSVEHDFLWESNAIESEFSKGAFDDAVKAWGYAKTLKKILPKDVLEIHYILMKRLMPDLAGGFRTCDVYIGGNVKRFISTGLLEHRVLHCLVKMHQSIRQKDKPDEWKEKAARDAHVEYEDIHPFPDGNGRSGRILYNWHRLKMGLPVHIIHTGEEQWEYYTWFR